MLEPLINPGLLHLDPDHVWLMHCADGPIPRSVTKGIQEFLHKEQWPWQMRWNEDFLGLPRSCRETCAQVIQVEPDDISLTANTSTGLQTLAQAMTWRAGDEIVAPLGEFPSNVWPWKGLAHRGVTFHEVSLWEGQTSGAGAWDSRPPTLDSDPEKRLLRFVRTGSRALAVSWIRFQDGLKLDLTRLGKACREHGVDLIVDGIQGAGTLIPDLSGVSAFVSGGHKGLLAPQGLGFLWTRPEFRRELQPTGTWLSVEEAEGPRPVTDLDRTWVPDGRKLEPGGANLMACAGLTEALKVLHVPGVAAISAHVRMLQHHLLESLDIRGAWSSEIARLKALLEADRLGPFLAFHHEGRGPEAMQELLARAERRGIFASVREGYLRIAFHGWHEGSDISRIVEWMDG